MRGKTVLVGVTGGIAAYKTANLVRLLREAGAQTHVMMTRHACEFVAPLTFETLSGNPVITDQFRRETPWEVEHVSLAKAADLVIVAPATANCIAKAANGFADKIDVRIYKDGSVSVEDNGRGIPTDIHPKTKVSGVEVVFTKLHAGGKFDEHNYSFSGGLHGVGASVTNALSKWLNVTVYKDGTTFVMKFHSYYDKNKKKFE